jgi:hypothetical protein
MELQVKHFYLHVIMNGIEEKLYVYCFRYLSFLNCVLFVSVILSVKLFVLVVQ